MESRLKSSVHGYGIVGKEARGEGLNTKLMRNPAKTLQRQLLLRAIPTDFNVLRGGSFSRLRALLPDLHGLRELFERVYPPRGVYFLILALFTRLNRIALSASLFLFFWNMSSYPFFSKLHFIADKFSSNFIFQIIQTPFFSFNFFSQFIFTNYINFSFWFIWFKRI